MTDYMGYAARVIQPTRRRLTVHDTVRRVPQDIKGDILKMLQDLLDIKGDILKMLQDLLGYARSRDS